MPVDPDLIRASMYIETSYGWYDNFYPWHKTILPINVHYEYWKELGLNKSQLQLPEINVHVETLIIKQIQDRLKYPRIRKIESVYNVLGRESISKYGAQVENIYRNKAWLRC